MAKNSSRFGLLTADAKKAKEKGPDKRKDLHVQYQQWSVELGSTRVIYYISPFTLQSENLPFLYQNASICSVFFFCFLWIAVIHELNKRYE